MYVHNLCLLWRATLFYNGVAGKYRLVYALLNLSTTYPFTVHRSRLTFLSLRQRDQESDYLVGIRYVLHVYESYNSSSLLYRGYIQVGTT